MREEKENKPLLEIIGMEEWRDREVKEEEEGGGMKRRILKCTRRRLLKVVGHSLRDEIPERERGGGRGERDGRRARARRRIKFMDSLLVVVAQDGGLQISG